MDAITMLRDDHRSVEKLFKRFEDAGPRAFVEKRKIVDRIIGELSAHAAIEERVFYPVTRATVPAVEQVALESLEEHHVVKVDGGRSRSAPSRPGRPRTRRAAEAVIAHRPERDAQNGKAARGAG